jgi:tetratricopeptide (TPR) repeat protein
MATQRAARAEFPVARITNAVPVVSALRGGKLVLLRARSRVFYGTSVRTGARGAARLKFSNGTLVSINRRSRLDIERPASASSPLVLRVAQAFSEVFVVPRGNTIVRTNAAIAGARGTQFLVRLLDENTTEVIVTEGSVDFSNPFGAVLIEAGQSSQARVGSAPTPPRAVDVTGELQWTAEVANLPLEVPTGPTASPALRAALQDGGEGARPALQVLAGGVGPESATALSALGLLELRAGRLDESRKYLQDAIARDANAPTPRALLSLLLLNQAQTAPAQQEARRAVELADRGAASNSERSLARSALAHALFFAGQTKEALREAGRAVALAGGEADPLSPLALLVQGRVFLAQNRPDQALESFAQAAALAPDLFLAQREAGAAYARREQLGRAEVALRRAIAIRGDDAQAHALLGDVLARRGRQDESRAAFGRALEMEPGNALARALLAQSLLQEGKLKDARAELERARTDDPEAGLVFVRLSEEALYRQDIGAAQEFARRGVAILPFSAPAHYQLGRVYAEQGRVSSAESQFRQAVTLDPNFDEARYALGLARERTERGLLGILDNANGAGSRTVGSAGSALALQNLQTPGADDRVQAIAGDPTSVRPATRAFGDFQIDGAVSSQRKDAGVSFLRQSTDRRDLYGINAERQDDDGPDGRVNADRTFDRAGFLVGRKSGAGAGGGFVLGEFERARQGVNTTFQDAPDSRSIRSRYELPRLLAGYNFQSRADARTRLLLQGQQLDQRLSDNAAPVFSQQMEDRSANLEVRHDQRLSARYQISAGLAFGRRRRDSNSVLPLFPGAPPATTSANLRVRQAQAWARGTFAVSPRLSLAGELRVLNLDYRSPRAFSAPGLPPNNTLVQSRFTTGVPLFIAAYQVDERSALRLRARRMVASVRDFELLLPNDPFSLAQEDLPGVNLLGSGARGRSVEVEYDRTFSNSSLLRVTLLQQDLKNADAASVGSNFPRARTRALRATYETPLGRDLSLFSALDVTSALDQVFVERIPLLPRVTLVSGLQYFHPRGLFADFLGAYVSESTFFDSNASPPISRRDGGFGVFTVRVGKRTGLRNSVYLEARNLFDKQFPRLNQLQPGRQIRVGAVSRF